MRLLKDQLSLATTMIVSGDSPYVNLLILRSGVLAYRICKRYRAVPLPLWWPALAVSLMALHKLGVAIVKPDQLTRLVSEKTGTAESAKTAREPLRRFLAN